MMTSVEDALTIKEGEYFGEQRKFADWFGGFNVDNLPSFGPRWKTLFETFQHFNPRMPLPIYPLADPHWHAPIGYQGELSEAWGANQWINPASAEWLLTIDLVGQIEDYKKRGLEQKILLYIAITGKDRAFSATGQREIAIRIPNANIVELEESGHGWVSKDSDQLVDLILKAANEAFSRGA